MLYFPYRQSLGSKPQRKAISSFFQYVEKDFTDKVLSIYILHHRLYYLYIQWLLRVIQENVVYAIIFFVGLKQVPYYPY